MRGLPPNPLRRANDFLLPPALGALATLGFAPFGWYGLTLLALAGLLALWWDAGPRRAAWRGWLFGLAHFGTGIYWVFVSTHVFGGAPLAVSAFLLCLLVSVLALFPAAVGLLAALARGLPRAFWALALVPAAWCLGELVRDRIGTGFPWLSLGYALTDAPLNQLPPLLGVYGMGALMAIAAGALVLLVRGGFADRIACAALVVAAALALWLLPPGIDWTRPAGEPLSVAILQGNIGQDVKWQPENLEPTKNRYRELSDSVEARLVIWPEATIPSLASMEREYLDAIDAAATERGRTELVGILVYDRPNDSFYNAMFALGAGQGRYYKRHLVPFGEYFPVPDFMLPLLDGVNLRFSSFAHGPERQPPIVVDGIELGLSICFEDAFPREIRKALPRARILVNVTNDAWFADTSAPHQHLQIARMRAMEAGRPLLRAANTGISAIIGADGRVRQRTPQFRSAILEAEVQPRAGVTPYVRYGDLPLALIALAICGLGLGASYLNRSLRHGGAGKLH